jgi:indole-3-glycerol phosphate synthase
LGRRDHRDFASALRRRAGELAIVAEFKRASPSAGPIRPDADPALFARAYERGGAAAISVLTEPERFGGSFGDLRAARAATSLPVLCKDFTVDQYQIYEAAAEGADAILLIAAALDAAVLATMLELSRSLGVAAIVEVHDEPEARKAISACAGIIGINNRDLRSFAVDTGTALRVRRTLPSGVIVIAESGYRDAEELKTLPGAGIDAVLVGESLMREADTALALSRLRGAAV